jgi:hypothetical protein
MALVTTRPNVTVFVSSMFTDMQVYRLKTQDALTQFEQIGSRNGAIRLEAWHAGRRVLDGLEIISIVCRRFWNALWECA